MLIWIFGNVKSMDVKNTKNSSYGQMILDNAEVTYKLSIDASDLPWDDWKPYRSIKVDEEEVEFSDGFMGLHNISYESILNGNGFGLSDVEPVIKLIDRIRKT
jgi:UDP-N-acetyl-2-amino-2-deoxyglucuronate dehydrogenase